jgi:hypothetical protein
MYVPCIVCLFIDGWHFDARLLEWHGELGGVLDGQAAARRAADAQRRQAAEQRGPPVNPLNLPGGVHGYTDV